MEVASSNNRELPCLLNSDVQEVTGFYISLQESISFAFGTVVYFVICFSVCNRNCPSWFEARKPPVCSGRAADSSENLWLWPWQWSAHQQQMHQSSYYPRTPLSRKYFASEKSFKGLYLSAVIYIHMHIHTDLIACLLTDPCLFLLNEPCCGKFSESRDKC